MLPSDPLPARDALAESQAQLAARTKQLEALREVGLELTRELDLPVLLRLILDRAVSLLGVKRGTIYLWNAETEQLVPHAWAGGTAIRLRLGEGAAGHAAATGKGQLVNDYPSWPHRVANAPGPPCAVLSEPLLYQGRLLGVLDVVHVELGRRFSEADQELMALLAAQAAIAMENARTYQAVQQELVERQRAEASLVRYRLLAEHGRDIVLFVERKTGQLVEANAAAVVTYGYAREELLRLRVHELRTAETAELAADQMARADAEGLLFETVHRRKDGTTFPVEVSSRGMDLDGRRVLLSVVRDISARKAAEMALAARTRQLEALREVSLELTRELDLTALLRLLIERAVTLLAGVSGVVWFVDPTTDESVARAWVGHGDWVSVARIPRGEGVVGTVIQHGKGLVENNYRESPYALSAFVERSGHTAVAGEPLVYRERVIGAITVDRAKTPFTADDQDLLRLFATQAAIAIENARLYETTVRRAQQFGVLNNCARALAAELDPARVVPAILTAATQLIPETVGQVWQLVEGMEELRLAASTVPERDANLRSYTLHRGEGLMGLALAENRPVISADVQVDPRAANRDWAAAQGLVAGIAVPLVHQDVVHGGLVLLTRTPHVFSEDEIVLLRLFAVQAAIAIENARLYAAAQQALLDRKRAEAEMVRSEQLRGLGQMAAGIAHDLNNTLATVLGQVDLAMLAAPPPAFGAILRAIETAATDGAATVRRLQDFARPRGTSLLSPCDLGQLVREAIEITRPRWRDAPQRQGATVTVALDLIDPLPILGNAPELREALTNLIFNAVDAMPGGGTLTFQGRATDSTVTLSVVDTGIGMSVEVQAKIFEPFFTTKGVHGSGLGLAGVYGTVKRHDGSISVASALGQGARFTLTFPRACEEAASAHEAAAPASAMHRLLFVDDDEHVRATLTRLLTALGHTVIEAQDGSSALDALRTTAVDLVFTDLGMPGMNGWQLARHIKTTHPDVPVILLTGWQDQAPGDAADRAAVDLVLGKPVRLADLLQAMATVRRG